MSIYALKPKFQALLRPISDALYQVGVTANQVTVTACLLSVALGAFLCMPNVDPKWFCLLPIWLLLRMALNAIDGMLAREHGQASKLGVYLNEMGDVISDTALYLPFAFVSGNTLGQVLAVILLAIFSELAGILGHAAGTGRRYDGPMGKSDRAFVIGVLGLMIGLGYASWAVHRWLWAAIAVLVAITIINRVRHGAR